MLSYSECADEQLVTAWQQGNVRAGGVLVTRYHGQIHRFFRYKFEPEVVEELVQATFFALSKAIDGFRGQASFRTYLFKIGRNKLNYHLRNIMRDRRRYDPLETSLKELGVSPSAELVHRAELRLLLTALRELPIDVQIMFELYHWERMAIVDIAEILEMNPATVKTRMRRGRIALRNRLEELASSAETLASSQSHISAWAARVHAQLSLAEGGV